METIAQTHAKLTARRKRTLILYVVQTLVYVLALVLLVLDHFTAALVLCVANLAVHLFVIRRLFAAYSDQVARASVLHGLCAPLEQADYQPKNSMTPEQFAALRLLPLRSGDPGALLCRSGFAGSGFGMRLTGFETTFHYPYTTPAGKTDYRFLSGTVLTADALPQSEVRGDWLLLRRDLLDPQAEAEFAAACGYRPAGCADALNADWVLYTRGEDAALPAWLEKQLVQALQAADSLSAVRLAPDGAAAYLANRFYTVRTRVRELPPAEALQRNPLPERDAVWTLFRAWADAYEN